MVNVCYNDLDLVFDLDVVKNEVSCVEEVLGKNGWFVFRKFGIELLICVMIEVRDRGFVFELVNSLVEVIREN